MNKHQWVELKMTPVEVELQPDGSLNVHAREAAIEIADEEAKLGCWHCLTELTAENHDDDCPASPHVQFL